MDKDLDSVTAPAASPGSALRPGVVTLRCPNCGGTVLVRAPGKSLSVACQSCGSVLDLNGRDVANIVKYDKPRIAPKIPIGRRGTFRGQTLECIGFLLKEEDGYRWQEYLLFNPRIGFRWLVCDAGHWNFCTPIPAAPIAGHRAFNADSLDFEAKKFKRYHIGRASVAHVEGEFYWRVRRNDAATSCDFVAPPYMVSVERSEGEMVWTRLEYIEPGEIAESFKITETIRTGAAANQPNPHDAHSKRVNKIALLTAALAVAVQLYFVIAFPAKQVLKESFSSVLKEPGPVTLGPIEFKHRTAAVELRTYAPVNNTWLDIDAELVNTDTDESYEFTQSIEHYSGVDSDGAWSEGSTNLSSMIASVPKGSYVLLLQPSSGAYGSYGPYKGPIDVTLIRDAHSWSAFLVVLGTIALYPLFVFVRRRSFAKRQWENSEYSPYASDEED